MDKNIGSIYIIIEGLKLDDIISSKKVIDVTISTENKTKANTPQERFNDSLEEVGRAFQIIES